MPQEIVDPLSFVLFLPFYVLSFMLTALPPLPPMSPVATATSSSARSYSNVEEWTISEMPNGTVKMIIHRKAQRG